ncbi:hypothetical protein ACFE04_031904 [Oxalis oulophora]
MSPSDILLNDGPQHTSTTTIQLFVRMISGGNSIVINAKSSDTIQSIMDRLHNLTGIPAVCQMLTYRGRILPMEKTLSDCAIANGASLHLVGRILSTTRSEVCRLIEKITTTAIQLYKCEQQPIDDICMSLKMLLFKFITNVTESNESEQVVIDHLKMFSSLSAPVAFVMLYYQFSPNDKKRQCADICINKLLNASKHDSLPKLLRIQFAVLVLDFCTLLKTTTSIDDPLYVKCRNALGLLVASTGISRGYKDAEKEGKESILVQDILPFVSELTDKLSNDLMSCALKSEIVSDFALFMDPLRNEITKVLNFVGLFPLPLMKGSYYEPPLYKEEVAYLYTIFSDLLGKLDYRLDKMEMCLSMNNNSVVPTKWPEYTTIIKQLNEISKLYEAAEKKYWMVMTKRKTLIKTFDEKYPTTSDSLISGYDVNLEDFYHISVDIEMVSQSHQQRSRPAEKLCCTTLLFFDVVAVRPRGLLSFAATSFPAVIGFPHQSWYQERLQARFISRRRFAPAQPDGTLAHVLRLGHRPCPGDKIVSLPGCGGALSLGVGVPDPVFVRHPLITPSSIPRLSQSTPSPRQSPCQSKEPRLRHQLRPKPWRLFSRHHHVVTPSKPTASPTSISVQQLPPVSISGYPGPGILYGTTSSVRDLSVDLAPLALAFD